MNDLRGLVAYPSKPPQIGQVISAAVGSLHTGNRAVDLSTWEENDIAGRFITSSILETIDDGQVLVADITQLNFNVVFEIGYAIGRQKRAYLVRSSAIAGSDDLIRQVGVFDALGFETYDSCSCPSQTCWDGDLNSHQAFKTSERLSCLVVVRKRALWDDYKTRAHLLEALRERQPRREAGAQSHGPLIRGGRAAEQRWSFREGSPSEISGGGKCLAPTYWYRS